MADLTKVFADWYLQINPFGYQDWINDRNIITRFEEIRIAYQKSFSVDNVFEIDTIQIDDNIKRIKSNCENKSSSADPSFAEYSDRSQNNIPNAILNKHFICFLENYHKEFRFNSADDLRDKVNKALGSKWCDEFQYLRKRLANLSKAASMGQLFKHNKSDIWYINEGGGVEIQYHLAFYPEENKVIYGLGFNTQYVPYENDMSPIEYMQPYMQAYLTKKAECQKAMYGCTYQWGSEEEMRNPQHNKYNLIGKSFEVWDDKNSEEDDEDFEYIMKKTDFEILIQNLKEWKKVYTIIFEERNKIITTIKVNGITMLKYIKQILASKNIILTGAPGTGKTSLAIKIAKEIVGSGNENTNIEFVQFHPSYDYTDFVEGLRPIKKDGQSEIGFELTNGVFKEFCKNALNKEGNYVFIIDEINRGEISKIFGELFFSIDPGYRGLKGKVKTQYANIQTRKTIFSEELEPGDFYVPDNVFIIGTMNDIDRSVESFDFAMRRRFTWMEITSEESAKNMNLSDDSRLRMSRLNNVISEKIEGLDSSYHIGAAYFIGLENGDYKTLWDQHIEPLLKEYLRGMLNIKKDLESLKTAYELSK
jgi:DNA polymerase III delta prime subunit